MNKSFFAVWGMVFLAAGPLAADDMPIVSPDHPAIWYNPAGMKVTQDLTWDHHRQQLVLHLAYDRVEFTPQNDQTYYDTFKLTFPTVQLNPSTHQLYFQRDDGSRVNIGRVVDGLLGNHVVLANGYQLSAHRVKGQIEARISIAPENQH